MIEFKNVTKIYEENQKAVDDVSLTVPDGETVVLLGPSGCGKTTLLRMVNRLNSITDGIISINGSDIHSMDKIELRRTIGYVIQSNGLFPNLTIEDNVVVVPDLLGWGKRDKRKRYNELMDLMGLDPDQFRKRYPHELSGGQQQRIGVARALAADPPVMLMDEPFAALDPIIRTHIQDEFLQIKKEVNKTIVFVSHDIDEAIKMGDKIAILKEGKLMQYDTPAELLAHPNSDFIAKFVGEDRALKSLSLFKIWDLMDRQQLRPIDAKRHKGEQIVADSDLKEALSVLLNNDTGALAVIDQKGKPLGSITMNHIETFLHQTIDGKSLQQGVEK
ncbi:ABC transporter ATP-binding protein [Tuberibacillus sp. Marseille-P3662]|uniref:ABC transporter ATP-binding protein n=1 Tax=Tuberibacillus sp. Marseille-P3662 TaxID=1965358 RepID=UPI000A1C9A92|nr:ABC transporter ATP-binding protein [Tuberibacillus sp. Marseille-P3662]